MDLIAAGIGVVVLALLGTVAVWTKVQLRYLLPLPPWAHDDRPASNPRLSIIIPARNEEANIHRCVASYRDQDYPASELEIIVVDDDSGDRTAEIVEHITEADPRVHLIHIRALPEGWLGKPHACWQGYQRSGGEWLCFTDADTRPRSNLVMDAVTYAETQGLDCLSLVPRQDAEGFWERVILPGAGLLTSVAASTDLRAFNDDARPEGAALGAFILVRREAYEAVGGHKAVKGRVVEDVHLGRLLKAAGHRLRLMDGAHDLHVRMYGTFSQIWQGFSKNLALVAGSTHRALLISAVALLVPWAAVALTGYAVWTFLTGPNNLVESVTSLMGVASLLAAFALHAVISRRMGINGWMIYALLFPVSYTISGAIMVNSVVWHRRNRITWKGRTIGRGM